MKHKVTDLRDKTEEQVKLLANEKMLASDGFILFSFNFLGDEKYMAETLFHVDSLNTKEKDVFFQHIQQDFMQLLMQHAIHCFKKLSER